MRISTVFRGLSAPAKGKYTFSAKATMDQWNGSNPLTLTVLKIETAAKKATKLTAPELKNKEETVIATKEAAELDAGDQIVLVPAYSAMHNACYIVISELKITAE